MTPLQIARIAHEVNRAFCASAIGDNSQKPWDEAPQWQKDSALAGVNNVINYAAGPEESHASWLAQKKADGWKYGPVKDAEKKEHPCMVPYDELPADQKVKDHLFVAVVRACMESGA